MTACFFPEQLISSKSGTTFLCKQGVTKVVSFKNNGGGVGGVSIHLNFVEINLTLDPSVPGKDEIYDVLFSLRRNLYCDPL